MFVKFNLHFLGRIMAKHFQASLNVFRSPCTIFAKGINNKNSNVMKNIEVGYSVIRDGNVILQDAASVKITDRQIPEIAKYILSDVEYQTGELVCVPSKIYDRIMSSV